VEPPVVEVVLDPRAADPADAPVDDDELAMVDVPESVEVPPSGAADRGRLDGSSQLGRSDDPDVDARGKKPVVERAAASVRIRTLAIDETRTETPSEAFELSTSANSSPMEPGRNPNWLM